MVDDEQLNIGSTSRKTADLSTFPSSNQSSFTMQFALLIHTSHATRTLARSDDVLSSALEIPYTQIISTDIHPRRTSCSVGTRRCLIFVLCKFLRSRKQCKSLSHHRDNPYLGSTTVKPGPFVVRLRGGNDSDNDLSGRDRRLRRLDEVRMLEQEREREAEALAYMADIIDDWIQQNTDIDGTLAGTAGSEPLRPVANSARELESCSEEGAEVESQGTEGLVDQTTEIQSLISVSMGENDGSDVEEHTVSEQELSCTDSDATEDDPLKEIPYDLRPAVQHHDCNNNQSSISSDQDTHDQEIALADRFVDMHAHNEDMDNETGPNDSCHPEGSPHHDRNEQQRGNKTRVHGGVSCRDPIRYRRRKRDDEDENDEGRSRQTYPAKRLRGPPRGIFIE